MTKLEGDYLGKKTTLKACDTLRAPRLATLPWVEQDKAYRWMWSVATDDKSTDNQAWVALDAIVRIWGDRGAQILLDGYIPEGRFAE